MDYIFVALKEGGIKIAVDLGAGTYDTQIQPRRGSVRFDDNKWHKMVITRKSREVGELRENYQWSERRR